MIDMLETESEKMAVIDFTERLEALYALRSAPHREALRRSFDMFCPDPDGGTDHASLKVAGHADGHRCVPHPFDWSLASAPFLCYKL